MYIATNRFQIQAGREDEFEKIWRERDSHLGGVAGFRDFKLLRGPTDDGATLYVSHSVWDSASEFEDWTKSDAFRTLIAMPTFFSCGLPSTGKLA